MPTGLCAPGFYCPGEEFIDTRTPSNFTCPAGYYCPEGSDAPVACPQGQFTEVPGQSLCDLCPAGFYCIGDRDNVQPIDCTPGHYCPAGTFDPYRCPNGTYTYDNETNLEVVDECRPCPAGYYCRHGFVSGNCSAGYFCLSGSEDYTPDDYDSTLLNAVDCVPNTHCAGACPAGHYCPEGTASPIPCEDGTYTTVTHTEQCFNCTPGYYCVTGDSLQPCPMGYYCPLGTGYVWQSCPAGTYSDQTGEVNLTGDYRV